MMNKALRVAITGASGFIGQYVVKQLLNTSVDITLVGRDIDKFSCYEGKARLVQLDIKNADTNVYELLNCPDVLIHLAWNGLSNYRDLYHFEQELSFQYEFLKEMVLQGLEKMLVTGTCFEYGMQSGALSESLDTFPSNPYGLAKDVLRKQLMFLKSSHPFSLTWARLFYMYGDGQPLNSLFSQLKKAVLDEDGIFNMSGGEQLRDYLPVTDVANFLVRLAMQEKEYGVVNVCSGKPVSVRHLVEKFIDMNGWKISLNLGYYSYPDYEPMAFWGSCDKLNRYIN